jgi:hypothetical protein
MIQDWVSRCTVFLNVFDAAVLNCANRLSEDQVREILLDEDANHFVFDDDSCRLCGPHFVFGTVHR